MTKATSHSEKKRRRRARKAEEHALTKDPFALAEVPRREPNGKPARREKAGADRPALVKRASMQNKAITDATIREMRAPWFGCNAGRAAYLVSPHDIEEHWQAICHMRRVVTTYDREIGAPNRHAQSLRLLIPSDRLEATAETPPIDERTPEKRQDDAVAAYMRLQGWMMHADADARHAASDAVLDDMPARDPIGIVNVLRCVWEGMTDKKIICRDRRKG